MSSLSRKLAKQEEKIKSLISQRRKYQRQCKQLQQGLLPSDKSPESPSALPLTRVNTDDIQTPAPEGESEIQTPRSKTKQQLRDSGFAPCLACRVLCFRVDGPELKIPDQISTTATTAEEAGTPTAPEHIDPH